MPDKKNVLNELTILIPTYNTGEKIYRTLENILGFFNIIIVDDGSTDNTVSILNAIKQTYIGEKAFEIYFNEENQGLAENRNILIKKVKTSYFTFLDAGDVLIVENIIKIVEKSVCCNKNIDLIFIDFIDISEEFYIKNKHNVKKISKLNSKYRLDFCGKGENYFCKSVIAKKQIDSACGIIYNTNFVKKKHFNYLKGYVHEDFGVTPYIILSAENVFSQSIPGYLYLREKVSITANGSNYKHFLNANHAVINAKRLMKNVWELRENKNINKKSFKIFNSYIANALIPKIQKLNGDYKKKYIELLNEMNIEDMYLKNLKGLAKKIIYKYKYRYK